MQKVTKVMMFVYKAGEEDKFFVVHRKTGDFVVPTGHVEEGETVAEAAVREVTEEFGVAPLRIEPTGYVVESVLGGGSKLSTEHAFLIQVPNQEITYDERGEVGDWHNRAELLDILTYEGQKRAVDSLII